MSIDLQELFDQAGREAPASSLDGDLVVRRGRRVRARRRAVAGTTTLVGVGVVAFGSIALAGTLPGGGQSTSVVGPAGGDTPVTAPSDASTSTPPTPSAPTTSTPPSNQEAPPVGLADVSLPDPAPGFPIRRVEDKLTPTSFGPGKLYWVQTFLLARRPATVTTDANGNTSGVPNGPEVTVFVGDFPAAKTSPGGTIKGRKVVASPTVAGVTGHVTAYTEKGTPVKTLYFSGGGFNVEVIGFGGVTTRELVDLGNAITGLH